MSYKISINYSPNFYSKKRKTQDIKFIILHYTGMRTDKHSINRLIDSESSVSCHYYIDKNGKIIAMVPDLYIAWHAGQSAWKRFKSLNKNSIGIEISNPGHQFGYKNFSSKQLNSLKKLIKVLLKKYKINYKNVLGHSDISPSRKKDPGEKFPWEKFAKKRLCFWHSLNVNQIKKFRNKEISNSKKSYFFKNLSKIGYKINNSNKDKLHIYKAFQRRFRQDLINSKIDEESYLISKNLLSI
tara:strand:+ start:2504 stop:3226 length:723 start_codon:yes stop_codon:yes gene_type:complete